MDTDLQTVPTHICKQYEIDNPMAQCYIFTKTEDINFLSKTADSDEYFLFHVLW